MKVIAAGSRPKPSMTKIDDKSGIQYDHKFTVRAYVPMIIIVVEVPNRRKFFSPLDPGLSYSRWTALT